MFKRVKFLFICISLILTGICRAETVTEDKKGIATLPEVVVTATKTPEERKNIPNAVIIIDETDIEMSAVNTIGELLANELGIDLRTYGNYGGAIQEIHFRGMSGDATQVYVNGVNVNSPSLGVADVARIPLNSIERIEVVKGAGSLLYGSGAMGGTVNIITKRPKRDKMNLKATAGYGTQNTYQLSAEQGMFLTDNFGYYLTAGRKKTGGFRDNSYLAHNDASFKLVYDKGDILDVSLYGDFIDREYGRPGVKPPSGTQNFYARGVQVYSGEAASMLDKGGDEDGHIVFQAKSDPLKWLGLNFKGEYTHMENNNFMRYYNSWTGGVPGQETWTTNEVKGFEGNLDLKPFDGANLLIGMEYRDYDWKNKSIKLDDDGNRKSGTRSRSTTGLNTKGAYAEVQYRPCKYVKALAGLRHEDHSTFGYEDIPRFGLVFNPLKETVLKFSRGKHFKAPTLNDLFWPYEDWGWGSGTEGNSNLKPETGWHTDLTAEQTLLNEKIFITLSYFKWDIDNKIRWVPDASFFYRPQNLDTYEADGWEVGTKIGPFYNFTLAVSYTDSDSKENKKGGSKRQALYTPDDQFKGSLTYWTEFGLNATATANYVGARPGKYDNDTDTSPSRILKSYWTVDLKIEQRLYDHWIVTLTGNNLFDKEYETYVDRFYDSTGAGTLCSYQGAGQSVFLSVGYEF